MVDIYLHVRRKTKNNQFFNEGWEYKGHYCVYYGMINSKGIVMANCKCQTQTLRTISFFFMSQEHNSKSRVNHGNMCDLLASIINAGAPSVIARIALALPLARHLSERDKR